MMNQARIRELFALLPPKAAYPPMTRRSPFQPRPTEAERYALALHDPAFGAHFVQATSRRDIGFRPQSTSDQRCNATSPTDSMSPNHSCQKRSPSSPKPAGRSAISLKPCCWPRA